MSIDAGPARTRTSLWRRLAWFVGLWAVSVAAIGVIAYGLRALLLP